MQLKDYYSILELPPSASREEIKKSYRRLALLYHPDKSSNDPYAAARFAAVKEAYETLTDPAKKQAYLHQRWYQRSQGIRSFGGIITPDLLLKKILTLDQYISRMDAHRRNTKIIADELDALITDDIIHHLKQFDETEITQQIVIRLHKISLHLDKPDRSAFAVRLRKLSADAATHDYIVQEEKKLQQAERWEQNKIWLILLTVSAICAIIYLANK